MAIPLVSVTVPSISATSLKLTINSETIDVDPAQVRAWAQNKGWKLDYLLIQIAIAGVQAGTDFTSGAAVKALIEGQQWKYAG